MMNMRPSRDEHHAVEKGKAGGSGAKTGTESETGRSVERIVKIFRLASTHGPCIVSCMNIGPRRPHSSLPY